MSGALTKQPAKLAPVALFVYNRPEHTRQTVQSLQKNQLACFTDLFVFADAAKQESSKDAVQQVRNYLKTIDGFRSVTVIEREHNLGLAKSVIGGITQVAGEFGRVIAVEDDLLTSSDFLTFMNQALERYKDEPRLFSVTGFNFPIEAPADYPYDAFCTYRSSSWGWGTWKDRWQKADWSIEDFPEFMASREKRGLFNRGGDDLTGMLALQMAGKLDSWAIRWAYAHYKNDSLALFPATSKVYNIGFDGSGVHCRRQTMKQSDLSNGIGTEYRFPPEVQANHGFSLEIQKLHRPSLSRRLVHSLMLIFRQ